MRDKSFEERHTEIREQMAEEGMSSVEEEAEDVYKNGLSALKMSGSRRGGRVYLPNERLALFWRRVFRVQFTDGGWRDTETGHQLEHPFAYSDAEIIVDESRSRPRFECHTTHEIMEMPIHHFNPVPRFFNDMIYLVRLHTGDDSYDMEDLKDDLRLFEDMEYDLAKQENCSRCNPEIY